MKLGQERTLRNGLEAPVGIAASLAIAVRKPALHAESTHSDNFKHEIDLLYAGQFLSGGKNCEEIRDLCALSLARR